MVQRHLRDNSVMQHYMNILEIILRLRQARQRASQERQARARACMHGCTASITISHAYGAHCTAGQQGSARSGIALVGHASRRRRICIAAV